MDNAVVIVGLEALKKKQRKAIESFVEVKMSSSPFRRAIYRKCYCHGLLATTSFRLSPRLSFTCSSNSLNFYKTVKQPLQ